jgi:hypothetical protein
MEFGPSAPLTVPPDGRLSGGRVVMVTARRLATFIAIPSNGRHMAREVCSQLAGIQRALDALDICAVRCVGLTGAN